MRTLFPIVLIVAGLAIGVYGYQQYDESGAAVSIGDIELSASDDGQRTQGYVFMGLGALGVVVGIGLIARTKK